MAKKKIKVGIIGCGMIFDRHIEAITTNSDAFEIAALCDIDERKLAIRSKEYQVLGFTDYKKMLHAMKKKMDLVTVATPNNLHFEQTKDSLLAGYDTITEKPIDFSHKQIEELVKISQKAKKKAYAVLQVRYNPTIQLVRRALAEKLLGNIRSASLIQRWQRPSTYFDSWRADIEVGGRTLYEVGIHYLDIFQYLLGMPEVVASASFNNKHRHVSFEDTVFAIMKLPEGASASVEVTIAAEPSNLECSLSLMGSEGFIKIGGTALDKIESAKFLTQERNQMWEAIASESTQSLAPNSYGTHVGSCPNHPTLYSEIARGRGIKLAETINSVKLIEDIYNKEVKHY